MAKGLRCFLNDVKALRTQQKAERSARLTRLKAMTPEAFVRVPREELQELSYREYAEVVRHVAPEHHLPELRKQAKPAARWWTGMRRFAVPTAARAVAFGVITGLLILAASLAVAPAIEGWKSPAPPLVRSIDASTWPPCHRLDPSVDGCTYLPAGNMTWERAASLLQIPERELRQSNRHINQADIPQQTMLIVWRHRGQLY
jgi:hypothetical protein